MAFAISNPSASRDKTNACVTKPAAPKPKKTYRGMRAWTCRDDASSFDEDTDGFDEDTDSSDEYTSSSEEDEEWFTEHIGPKPKNPFRGMRAWAHGYYLDNTSSSEDNDEDFPPPDFTEARKATRATYVPIHLRPANPFWDDTPDPAEIDLDDVLTKPQHKKVQQGYKAAQYGATAQHDALVEWDEKTYRRDPNKTYVTAGAGTFTRCFYFGLGLFYPAFALGVTCLISQIPTMYLALLGQCFLTILKFHALVAVPSVLLRKETFVMPAAYLSFIAVVFVSAGLPITWEGFLAATVPREVEERFEWGLWRAPERHWRQAFVSFCVLLWAGRLAIYTLARNIIKGYDSRFDAIRNNPRRFLWTFPQQIIWVLMCCLPVITINAIPGDLSFSETRHILDRFVFWVFLTPCTIGVVRGLVMEWRADWEITKWRVDKWRGKHDQIFFNGGLWKYCRHPNIYFDMHFWWFITFFCALTVNQQPARQTLGLNLPALVVVNLSTAWFVFKYMTSIVIPAVDLKYFTQYRWLRPYKRWAQDSNAFWCEYGYDYDWKEEYEELWGTGSGKEEDDLGSGLEV